MNQARRILLVDSEPQVTRGLSSSLQLQGYRVRVATDGLTGIESFTNWHPDLVITDLGMPFVDGMELCRRLRAISQIPLIVLSSNNEESTKVQAFDTGADDFINKPFGMNELLARIRASLRRASNPPFNTMLTIFDSGDFHVDLDCHQISVRNKRLYLTPKEFDLLLYFIKHEGKLLKHRTMLEALWGGDFLGRTEYLRVFVRHLRKKIEKDPAKPGYILTHPWVGYRFDPAPTI
jgi:two-component system, OmpR family, KDP operon response regulator KdpE